MSPIAQYSQIKTTRAGFIEEHLDQEMHGQKVRKSVELHSQDTLK